MEIKIENMKNLWISIPIELWTQKCVSLINFSSSLPHSMCKKQLLKFNNFQNFILNHFRPKVIQN
jgi:hypothetical protein